MSYAMPATTQSSQQMYDTLIDDVEYLPEDLVCGDQISDTYGVPIGELDTLLCLKHIAAKSRSGIVEVRSGVFMLAAPGGGLDSQFVTTAD
jgi:hypothetical protein